MERVSNPSFGRGYHFDTFVMGFGFPFRYRLNRYVALVSGSTDARGFGTPLALQQYNQSFLGAVVTSTDLLAIQTDAFGLNLSAFAQIGLLVQACSVLSLSVKAGYRFLLWRGGVNVEQHFVPVAGDLVFNVRRRVDVGFSATILGLVATRGLEAFGPGIDLLISSLGPWRGIQRYDFFVAARF
jgi:hypothetical protein